MAKVLVVYDADGTTLIGRYYCSPGEDESMELARAAVTHIALGHVCVFVEHDAPETMNHDEAIAARDA